MFVGEVVLKYIFVNIKSDANNGIGVVITCSYVYCVSIVASIGSVSKLNNSVSVYGVDPKTLYILNTNVLSPDGLSTFNLTFHVSRPAGIDVMFGSPGSVHQPLLPEVLSNNTSPLVLLAVAVAVSVIPLEGIVLNISY